VPATIGQTVSEATTTVQDAGLVVYVKPVSSSKNIGQVVAQTPAAGAQADTGSTVQINVSRGTGQVAVPKLVGLLSGPAQAQLTQLGLEPNVVSVPSSEPKGTVVAQNPNPGVQLAIGATVRMNVSSG
jgi:serine/threonine-protein kinase